MKKESKYLIAAAGTNMGFMSIFLLVGLTRFNTFEYFSMVAVMILALTSGMCYSHFYKEQAIRIKKEEKLRKKEEAEKLEKLKQDAYMKS